MKPETHGYEAAKVAGSWRVVALPSGRICMPGQLTEAQAQKIARALNSNIEKRTLITTGANNV